MASATSVVLYDPRDTSLEVRAIAGFLTGYSGRTREAYTLDLGIFYRWCAGELGLRSAPAAGQGGDDVGGVPVE